MRTFGLVNVKAHVGRQNVTADVYADTPYSEQYDIALAITHPQYSDTKQINDIGYIKTSIPVRFRYVYRFLN